MRRVLSDELRAAADEARRFLARVEALEERMGPTGQPWAPTVEPAAVRRASLDLTRALATMRRCGMTTWGES